MKNLLFFLIVALVFLGNTKLHATSYPSATVLEKAASFFPKGEVLQQEVIITLHFDGDTIKVSLPGGKTSWVLIEEILPEEGIAKYYAYGGESAKIAEYFKPYTVGRFVDKLPTLEQIQRSRDYWSYRKQKAEVVKAGMSPAMLIPVVEAGITGVTTYLILNHVKEGLRDNEMDIIRRKALQEFRSELRKQLAENIQRSNLDINEIFVRVTFLMPEVTISAQALRFSSEDLKELDDEQLVEAVFEILDDVEAMREMPPPTPSSRDELENSLSAALLGSLDDLKLDEIFQSLEQRLEDKLQLGIIKKEISRRYGKAVSAKQELTREWVRLIVALVEDVENKKNQMSIRYMDSFNKFQNLLEDWLFANRVPTLRRVDDMFRELPFDIKELDIIDFIAFCTINQERDLEPAVVYKSFAFPTIKSIDKNKIVILDSLDESELLTIMGHFSLESAKVIGHGSTAKIWASDQDLRFVVKVIDVPQAISGGPQKEAERQKRAKEVLEGYGGLRIPHIYAAFYSGKNFIILQERLLGVTLSEAKASPEIFLGGYLTTSTAERLAADLEGGISCLHRCGIVHYDLHEGNILIGRDGEEYIIGLVDFGLSLQKDETSYERWTAERLAELSALSQRRKSIMSLSRKRK